jgi:hypothetical protein
MECTPSDIVWDIVLGVILIMIIYSIFIKD